MARHRVATQTRPGSRRAGRIFITSRCCIKRAQATKLPACAHKQQDGRRQESPVSSNKLEPHQAFSKLKSGSDVKWAHKKRAKEFACILLIGLVVFSEALESVAEQEAQLPTVIVRGFLNYRTTVDGTVLLFTPDVGQQQPVVTASSTMQTSPAAQIQATSAAAAAATFFMNEHKSSEIQSQRAPVEPRSVLLVSSRPTTLSNIPGQPVAHPDSEPANDEWRPVQATPPLRPRFGPAQSTPSSRQDEESPPSVQADDVTTARPKPAEPEQKPDTTAAGTPPSSPAAAAAAAAATTSRPKRPSLGFTGQSARSRPSNLQNRFKAADGSASINGIRRPGLLNGAQTTPAPLTSSARESTSESSASAASAFQSRLASANTRLRNRQRHRQPLAADNSTSLSGSSGALLLPDGALDVASSMEQPSHEHANQEQLQRSFGAQQQSAALPVVGSDEVLLASGGGGGDVSPSSSQQQRAAAVDSELTLEPINPDQAAGLSALSRAGELRPSSLAFRGGGGGGSGEPEADSEARQSEPKLLSGGLQQGALSSGSMSFDALFQNDQPASSSSQAPSVADARPAQEHTPLTRPNGSSLAKARPALPHQHHHHNHQHHQLHAQPQQGSNNDKLSGWLGQHHNKFVARPAAKQQTGELSQQLASNLNQLAPLATLSPTAQILPTATISSATNQTAAQEATSNSTSSSELMAAGGVLNATLAPSVQDADPDSGGQQSSASASVGLQTITKTYSTILETSKTRLVPLQVKSSTAIYTITEDYVMTKMMTAYQTMPAGEFILPELSTRSPFEVFVEEKEKQPQQPTGEQPVVAPAAPAISSAPIDTQEQPISLDASPKSANNWLHDFTAQHEPANQLLGDPFQQSSQQQQQQQPQQLQQTMLALLEQQAREANLANFGTSSADLEQLASQLDPAALLADGAINIPDLNNPLVLAAAIQNPQLAAVILAAQQLRLKQRAGLKPELQQKIQQQQQQQFQLQPSYSTSFSTTLRPSTYTARDTMYTTRLVSFRDGRTVRTRTVSEPGSVVEQVLTTTLTETVPITLTIRPTGVLALAPAATAGAASGLNSAATSAGQLSNQATINNALFATQLANILARRQQQLQTSFNNPALANLGATNSAAGSLGQPSGAATPQQLLALQQLFGQQKRQQQQQQQQGAGQSNQFQPNLQQLLQSMQPAGSGTSSSSSSPSAPNSNPAQQQQAAANANANADRALTAANQQQTPLLAQVPKSIVSSPVALNGPISTTLTSLQVRTYTVHNAFKTIFRTITSTLLVPTVLPSG